MVDNGATALEAFAEATESGLRVLFIKVFRSIILGFNTSAISSIFFLIKAAGLLGEPA
jgi:hypothetical protein